VVLLATNAFGSDSNSYRVAVVGDHDVDALQSGVATIEPVSQATVAFPVAGTVSAVNVKVGDQVAVGQALASLNPQSLMDNLHTQEAALAQAQLTLSKALSGQSVGSAGGTGGSGGSGGTGSGGANAALSSARTAAAPTAVLTAATPTDPQLATLQQAVVSAQQGVDAALAASKTALDNATAVCASAGAGKTGPPPTTVPPATGSTGSAGTAGASPQDAGLTACQTALSNVLTAQHAADTAQHKLADASTALDAYLAQKAATPAPTPTTTPSVTSGGTGRTGAGGSGASGGSGSSGGSSGGFGATSRSTAPTAADIASYQAAVDAATANVAAAYQAVAQGTITTPIQGTVVAVSLTPGAAVTAGSTTADVVVQGAGGFEVTTSVNVTKISNVAVGQKASVVPDGSHTALPGKVTSISVAPTSVTNTATNYRVVVGLDNPNRRLGNGSTGTVTIVTKSAKASLAVPTSALTPLGRRYTVNVLQDGTPQTVVVGVGVVGATWTEVTSGLTRGQEVVLADLSQPLPSSATSSSNGSTGTNGANGLNGIGGGRFFFGGGAGGGGIRVPGGGAGR
jgi:multidrug efflux pump subunit AcrA (membrane-fusion protein)